MRASLSTAVLVSLLLAGGALPARAGSGSPAEVEASMPPPPPEDPPAARGPSLPGVLGLLAPGQANAGEAGKSTTTPDGDVPDNANQAANPQEGGAEGLTDKEIAEGTGEKPAKDPSFLDPALDKAREIAKDIKDTATEIVQEVKDKINETTDKAKDALGLPPNPAQQEVANAAKAADKAERGARDGDIDTAKEGTEEALAPAGKAADNTGKAGDAAADAATDPDAGSAVATNTDTATGTATDTSR